VIELHGNAHPRPADADHRVDDFLDLRAGPRFHRLAAFLQRRGDEALALFAAPLASRRPVSSTIDT
jgi:hypothetical protein